MDLLVRLEILASVGDIDVAVQRVTGQVASAMEPEDRERFTKAVIEASLGDECFWWKDLGLRNSLGVLNASGDIAGAGQVPASGSMGKPTADPSWVACIYRVELEGLVDSAFYEFEAGGQSFAVVSSAAINQDDRVLVIELLR
jgi:hypothetical protein